MVQKHLFLEEELNFCKEPHKVCRIMLCVPLAQFLHP